MTINQLASWLINTVSEKTWFPRANVKWWAIALPIALVSFQVGRALAPESEGERNYRIAMERVAYIQESAPLIQHFLAGGSLVTRSGESLLISVDNARNTLITNQVWFWEQYIIYNWVIYPFTDFEISWEKEV